MIIQQMCLKRTKALVTSLSEPTIGNGLLDEETTSSSSAIIKSSAVIPNSTALKEHSNTV